MKSPDYGENPEHYKNLIAKINEEANFPMYLHQNGYKLMYKSAGSMEFHNDKDRIVLKTNRTPVTYFNRNDSLDKGLFFKYLMHRNSNFYKAVQTGLELVNQVYTIENAPLEIKSNNSIKTALEQHYTILPLRNSQYLNLQRGISHKTIHSTPFKGRIFNAYHIKDTGHNIANIAFPKYSLKGNAKNYILYNKPYRSKKDNKIRKFRMILNQKDHFLFHSKPIERPARILFGESGIDLLSYHELHGKPDNFYVSFGGNIYREKLAFFLQLVEPLLGNNNVELTSIMDNDPKGREYDLKVFCTLINRYNPNISIDTAFRSGNLSMNIHYSEKVQSSMPHHAAMLNQKLSSNIRNDDGNSSHARCVGFSDKILLEFSLMETVNTAHISKKEPIFQTVLDTVNSLYLPFKTKLCKSQGKDWNDDLRASKKDKYRRADVVLQKDIAIGDKIGLHAAKGPEGSSNQGVVIAIKDNSLECDFGLSYTYAIPFTAIKAHFKKNTIHIKEQDIKSLKTNSKNNNLQNYLS